MGNFNIEKLGACTIPNPIKLSKVKEDGIYNYIEDGERILQKTSLDVLQEANPISFEKAGPKEHIYFEPSKVKAAIVTCGGLCPGLNNVIRGIVNELWYRYGVKQIIGVKYGYAGLIPEKNIPFINLDPDIVDDIHKDGGTMLGSSRGGQSTEAMVDTLEREGINILYTVGGDGTQRGAHDIHTEIAKRGLKISIAGIPKTIDNDLNYIRKTFGFETAFSSAQEILINAHYEAKGAQNGVALVKLMGRDSGFIAANAALAVPDVNFVLVPEVPFALEGDNGFFNALQKRLEKRGHAVIVVAEGAGQELFTNEAEVKDASGNILHQDIGTFLRDKIKAYFKGINFQMSIKYIDPSYIIRSAPANANDAKFCNQLAQYAVHGTMAGKTDFIIGYWHQFFTYIPIEEATRERKEINPESELWHSVLEATGQPMKMKDK